VSVSYRIDQAQGDLRVPYATLIHVLSAGRVTPFRTHRGSMLRPVACSIDLRGGKWDRTLVYFGGLIVSSCVSADREVVVLKCCES